MKKKVIMINTLYRIITFLYCRVPSQDLVQSALLHQLLIFTMEQLLVIPAGRITVCPKDTAKKFSSFTQYNGLNATYEVNLLI